MTKCPACQTHGNAATATPHCPSRTCTWNKCKCGATYDRNTGNGYSASAHHPAEGEVA